MPATPPTLRLLRHLARTGGTVISKALGCMDAALLLSETHPLAMDRWTNLLAQAEKWHGLTAGPELAAWKKRGVGYAEALALLNARAEARGKRLLVREWTHLDLLGEPFVKPTMTPAATRAVEGAFALRVVDTVRHPLDHWGSLHHTPTLRRVTLERHLASCAAFARETSRLAESGRPHVLVKYEDFCVDPETSLRTMCAVLDLPYDEEWAHKWATYAKITGDTAPGRGNAGATIQPLARRQVEDSVREACLVSADYLAACAAWGYDPAG